MHFGTYHSHIIGLDRRVVFGCLISRFCLGRGYLATWISSTVFPKIPLSKRSRSKLPSKVHFALCLPSLIPSIRNGGENAMLRILSHLLPLQKRRRSHAFLRLGSYFFHLSKLPAPSEEEFSSNSSCSPIEFLVTQVLFTCTYL